MNEYGRVTIPTTTNVWMAEAELSSLFGTIAPTLRTAIQAVYKSGVLKQHEVERLSVCPMATAWTCMPCLWSWHSHSASIPNVRQGYAMPYWKGCTGEKKGKSCGCQLTDRCASVRAWVRTYVNSPKKRERNASSGFLFVLPHLFLCAFLHFLVSLLRLRRSASFCVSEFYALHHNFVPDCLTRCRHCCRRHKTKQSLWQNKTNSSAWGQPSTRLLTSH